MENSEWFMWAGVLLCLFNVVLATVLILKARKREQAQKDPANLDGYLTVTGYDEDTNLADLRLTITRHPNELAEKEIAQLTVGTPPPTLN